MEAPRHDRAQLFWLSAARSLAWRRNFAYWCDSYAPIFIGVSALAAIGLLIQRLLGQSTASSWFVLAGGLLVGALVSALVVWRKRVSLPEALSCLDEMAHLHNRLVSAQAGVGKWPAARSHARDTTRWNWRRLASPILVVVLLLAAVMQAPLLEATTRQGAVEEPMTWTQVDAWLRTLEEAKLAEPQALAAIQEQLNELRQKPSEEWYDHNGLEAGDALRQRMDQGLKEMRGALEQGSKAIGAMQQLGESPSLSEMQGVSNSVQQAAQGLKAGSLPVNQDLQERLKKAGVGSPKQMTAAQMADLQQRMNEGIKTVNRCVSPQIVEGDFGQDSKEGSGGKGGGGKSQPVGLSEQPTRLETERVETSSNEEMSRALPGDLLAITSSSHDVDRKAPFNAQSAGDVSTSGAGGDAVWRDSVTPDERQVLERYFK